MKILEKLGLALFIIAMILFTAFLGWNTYELNPDSLSVNSPHHKAAILSAAGESGMLNKEYTSNIGFIKDFKSVVTKAQTQLNDNIGNKPADVGEWDYKIGDWAVKDMVKGTVMSAGNGWVSKNPMLAFLLTFGLGALGGLLFILPKFFKLPGIKNDNIYHSSMTRGLTFSLRSGILILTILGVLAYGFFYMDGKYFWPLVTAVVAGIIILLVLFKEKQKDLAPVRSASSNTVAWMGLFTGAYLIGFYILLYWQPQYISNWITMVSPISEKLSGNPASEWFLYGLMYCVVVVVMGIRMISKYRHNKYQMVRTASVMFFQTCIAFLLPEILVRLNYPYFDFKNIWPLNYSFFFDWNINQLIASGNLGIFMLVWGIVLTIVGVPLITYFFGKRWYCSWVCGCGGLAETLGDPFRQLSDKSLRAWKYERWIIHGVLAFAIVMTAMVLYTYFTGSAKILSFDSNVVRKWYGFIISAGFAGVVGTGFYPLMGNRTWCRFGCPLAAYLGLVQKFKSRFRITTNGSQCISCGNCSTYCEMGIDVRSYAQKGQDIVRSSCVGCGVCAAVCPRGVLRLENASGDVGDRTKQERNVHVEDIIRV